MSMSNKNRSTSRKGLERLEARRLLAADTIIQLDGSSLFGSSNPVASIPSFYGPVQPGRANFDAQGISRSFDGPPDSDHPLADNDSEDGSDQPQEGDFPNDETFKLHSRPDSHFTIFLDFDGHVSRNTLWNQYYGFDEIVHPNYWRGTGDNFSNSQLSTIQSIWRIVAEDFAPFDVNITTEEPTDLGDLSKDGAADTRWGTRVVMTKDTFADCGCGGHAFLNSFDAPGDEIALVYNGSVNAGSETVTHEVGHQLGLGHHGAGSSEYYRGHGSAATGWGPIMGAPFSKNVTHWSNADYFNATRTTQDDLAVITRAQNFPYAVDDHGDDAATSTLIENVTSTRLTGYGIIERNTDQDWFNFATEAGTIDLSVDVLGRKPNLDAWAGLYDASGNFIAQANDAGSLSADFGSIDLSAGTYFVRVEGVARNVTYDPVNDTFAEPDPLPYAAAGPSGYSSYGSLGQYQIDASIIASSSPKVSIEATTDSIIEGGNAVFDLTADDAGSPTVTVMVRPVGQGAPSVNVVNPTEAEDFGTFNQTVTLVNGAATLSVPIVDDGIFEPVEGFEVVIVDAGTHGIATHAASMLIDEASRQYAVTSSLPSSNAESLRVFEGDDGPGDSQSFEILRAGNTQTSDTVGWRVLLGQSDTDANDFDGPISGTISFATGQTTASFFLTPLGDLTVEGNESYVVELYDPAAEGFLIDPVREQITAEILEDESTIRINQSIQFRFRQLAWNDGNFDHWAIDNVVVTETNFNDDFDPDVDLGMWQSIVGGSAQSTFPQTDGLSLFFSGRNPRIAQTNLLEPTPGANLRFDLAIASVNEGGLNATESGEDIVLEFSADQGSTWQLLQRFDEEEYPSWTPIDIPLPQVAVVPSREFAEGDGGGANSQSFQIRRTGYLGKTATLDWQVAASGTNSVDADDFVGGLPGGQINFAIGEEFANVVLPISADDEVEDDETFVINYSNFTGGPLSGSSASGVFDQRRRPDRHDCFVRE